MARYGYSTTRRNGNSSREKVRQAWKKIYADMRAILTSVRDTGTIPAGYPRNTVASCFFSEYVERVEPRGSKYKLTALGERWLTEGQSEPSD